MKTKSSKRYFLISALLFISFLIFTILLKMVNVKAIGPNGSEIGFADLNYAMFNFFGSNFEWHSLANVFMICSLLVAFFFMCKGLIQLLKRKHISKVDPQILVLGVLFVLIVVFYIIFEILTLNYRPMLIDGKLESSYPSSHTMVVCCIMTASAIISNYFIKNKFAKTIYIVLSSLIVTLTAIARIASGYHWFTDIIGAILLSASLIMLFYALVKKFCSKTNS